MRWTKQIDNRHHALFVWLLLKSRDQSRKENRWTFAPGNRFHCTSRWFDKSLTLPITHLKTSDWAFFCTILRLVKSLLLQHHFLAAMATIVTRICIFSRLTWPSNGRRFSSLTTSDGRPSAAMSEEKHLALAGWCSVCGNNHTNSGYFAHGWLCGYTFFFTVQTQNILQNNF